MGTGEYSIMSPNVCIIHSNAHEELRSVISLSSNETCKCACWNQFFLFLSAFLMSSLILFYALQLICYSVSWLLRCGIVPQYWPGSSLIPYQMDGRIMRGIGLIKEIVCEYCSRYKFFSGQLLDEYVVDLAYFCIAATAVRIKHYVWKNFHWYSRKHHHMFHGCLADVLWLETREIFWKQGLGRRLMGMMLLLEKMVHQFRSSWFYIKS